jgi:hypothetical protein
MTTPDALTVVVVGRAPEKMAVATAVVESHGFAAIGVFSEEEARQTISEHDGLFAVVTGGAIDESGRERLRVVAATKGAVLITANIGHDDPDVHFTTQVVPKLIETRDRGGSVFTSGSSGQKERHR